MTRMQTLASRPKRTLGALAVVLAAVGITVGSGANFTASSANVGNSFATGTLTMSNTPGTNFFRVSNLKPGQSGSGIVDIGNTGSLAGDFYVSGSAYTGYAPLQTALDLVVEDCGTPPATGNGCPSPTQKFSGKLSGFNGQTALGNFAAGDVHRYRFTVTLPGSVDDTYQGKTAGMDINWSAQNS